MMFQPTVTGDDISLRANMLSSMCWWLFYKGENHHPQYLRAHLLCNGQNFRGKKKEHTKDSLESRQAGLDMHVVDLVQPTMTDTCSNGFVGTDDQRSGGLGVQTYWRWGFMTLESSHQSPSWQWTSTMSTWWQLMKLSLMKFTSTNKRILMDCNVIRYK